MKLFFILFVLQGGDFSLPAADSVPAPSNLPGTDYPRIGSGLGVTFRLKAPDAKQVKLEGGAGLVKEPKEMSRSDDGVWTVTTPPAVPGFHYYGFVVDGVRVNDAASYIYFGYGRETSGIDIPEAGAVCVDWWHEQPAAPGLRHGDGV